VDEYSRFPFAYPCKEITADTLITNLLQVFSIFGCPSAIHSDRGAQFESDKFNQFLLSNGIVKTRTTPYRPQGNGQCERTNATICKAICLSLKENNLHKSQWSKVLPQALASIRSLLCTATNQTPHERLFTFQRTSKFGEDLPTFLTNKDSTVLYRLHLKGKGDQPTQKVTLLETISPYFSRVKFDNGRESTVSTRDLAALPHETPEFSGQQVDAYEACNRQDSSNQSNLVVKERLESDTSLSQPVQNGSPDPVETNLSSGAPAEEEAETRTRCGRKVQQPSRFHDYVCSYPSGDD